MSSMYECTVCFFTNGDEKVMAAHQAERHANLGGKEWRATVGGESKDSSPVLPGRQGQSSQSPSGTGGMSEQQQHRFNLNALLQRAQGKKPPPGVMASLHESLFAQITSQGPSGSVITCLLDALYPNIPTKREPSPETMSQEERPQQQQPTPVSSPEEDDDDEVLIVGEVKRQRNIIVSPPPRPQQITPSQSPSPKNPLLRTPVITNVSSLATPPPEQQLSSILNRNNNPLDHSYSYQSNRSRIGKHICSKCDAAFPSSQQLYYHRKQDHQSFRCPFCYNIFLSLQDIQSHLYNAHHKLMKAWLLKKLRVPEAEITQILPSSGYRCKFCYLLFPSVQGVRTHLEIEHTRVKADRISDDFILTWWDKVERSGGGDGHQMYGRHVVEDEGASPPASPAFSTATFSSAADEETIECTLVEPMDLTPPRMDSTVEVAMEAMKLLQPNVNVSIEDFQKTDFFQSLSSKEASVMMKTFAAKTYMCPVSTCRSQTGIGPHFCGDWKSLLIHSVIHHSPSSLGQLLKGGGDEDGDKDDDENNHGEFGQQGNNEEEEDEDELIIELVETETSVDEGSLFIDESMDERDGNKDGGDEQEEEGNKNDDEENKHASTGQEEDDHKDEQEEGHKKKTAENKNDEQEEEEDELIMELIETTEEENS